MLTIEQLSRFAHQLSDEARVRAGYYKEQLRQLQARQAEYRRVLMRRTSLESASRGFKRRSTDISNAPDVGSIKQRDPASIRSPAPPERTFSDATNAILRFRHLPRIRSLFCGFIGPAKSVRSKNARKAM
jgi:hypothetical protein